MLVFELSGGGGEKNLHAHPYSTARDGLCGDESPRFAREYLLRGRVFIVPICTEIQVGENRDWPVG